MQVREKTLSAAARRDFAARVVSLCRRHGARVLINADAELALELGADGVHLTSAQLRTLTERPRLPWSGASCHSAEELRFAERLGADFAVLGPVRATPTHPAAATLQWAGFRAAAVGAAVPVYALGGLAPADLGEALACGAHGLAMVRGAWSA